MNKKCNLCDSKEIDILYKFSNKRILFCKNCGLIFSEINNLKLKNYYNHTYAERIRDNFRIDMTNEEYAHLILKQILELVKIGKILDVGCGAGYFLDYAKRLGWQIFGVELIEKNAKYAKEKFGLNVITGRLEDLDFPDNFFDVITMLDLIEHLVNPTAALSKINRLLKKDGLLCIETPNAGSIYHLLLKKKWISFAEDSHIYFFNRKNLEKILSKTGFHLVQIITPNVNFFSFEGLRRIRIYRYYYNFYLIVKKIFSSFNFEIRDNNLISQFLKFESNLIKLINYPTNKLFESLYLGDQIRAFAIKR